MDSIGKLEQIMYFPAKGAPGVSGEERKVSPEYGLEGDWHGLEGDSSLTIWTKEAREALTSRGFSGICFQRFKENLSVSGLDLSKYAAGTRLRIGDAVLEVQAKKKKCHPDVCPLTEGRADCLRKKQSRYVTVAESGTLVRGAQVQAEEIQ